MYLYPRPSGMTAVDAVKGGPGQQPGRVAELLSVLHCESVPGLAATAEQLRAKPHTRTTAGLLPGNLVIQTFNSSLADPRGKS